MCCVVPSLYVVELILSEHLIPAGVLHQQNIKSERSAKQFKNNIY